MTEYARGMNVRVKLHTGQTVDAVVKNVVEQVTGTKLQIAFGNQTMMVGVEQVIERAESP